EMWTRRDAVHLLERVGAEDGVVRARDAAVLVDPETGRDVDDAVEVRDDVLGVDQRGVRGLRGLDPGPGVVGVSVERDGQDDEAGRRHAHVALAEPLRLQLPAERALRLGRRKPNPVGSDRRIDLDGARLVEEGQHYFFSIDSNSTSKTRVEPGLMVGGEPRSP